MSLMLSSEITYIVNDERCHAAMADIESGMDTLKWVGQNLDLYMNVTYAPEGYPRIPDCNYSGKVYDNILQFASLYMEKHNEIEDPFSDPPED